MKYHTSPVFRTVPKRNLRAERHRLLWRTAVFTLLLAALQAVSIWGGVYGALRVSSTWAFVMGLFTTVQQLACIKGYAQVHETYCTKIAELDAEELHASSRC